VHGILVDAGPLIALLDRSDSHHGACVAALRSITEPLVSVWPAIAEAMYLLAFSRPGQDALWELIVSEAVAVATLDHTDAPRMRALMAKYADLPMDLADAALVRVAEREKIRRVLTLDRRHFSVYRPSRLGRFAIVP
jgi:predicted nucleic acid-binding protein